MTDDDINDIMSKHVDCDGQQGRNFARVIEALVKEETEAHLMQSHEGLMDAASAKHRIAKAEHLADSNEGMAESMRMFRKDMIDAGVIGDTVPPMFMTEAILGAIGKVKNEAEARTEEYSDYLRGLCCSLSVGGWNTEGLMPVATATEKINAGLAMLVEPWRDRAIKAEADRDHWKANHGNMVSRCALLSQRPDLPVDRIPAFQELVRLQGLKLKTVPRLDSDPAILDEDLPTRALRELTEQAQELDMGYGPNACPTCGKSRP